MCHIFWGGELGAVASNQCRRWYWTVQVILWKEQKECMAQHQMIHECNSSHYICVIGEVKKYYGVHEIIAFDV
jgi:hypothetical protein